jgi:oxygen-independent coproporphyrinogen-3 oxidase
LYFHLPFCETLCWFCGCHQITTLNRERGNDYLDLLEKELELFAKHLPAGREVVQMHFGGGTPNFL